MKITTYKKLKTTKQFQELLKILGAKQLSPNWFDKMLSWTHHEYLEMVGKLKRKYLIKSKRIIPKSNRR